MYSKWVPMSLLDSRIDAYRYTPEFVDTLAALLTSGLPVERLDAIRKADSPINYGILQPRAFIDAGIPMVRAVDLHNPFIDQRAVARVPPDVELPYRRSRLQHEDVLISIAGSLGMIGLCPKGWETANVNQSVARVRVGNGWDSAYVAAFLMSRCGQTLLAREAVGSVQRHFNIEDIREVCILRVIPELQRAIGNKLRKAMLLIELERKAHDAARQAMYEICGAIPFESKQERLGWHLSQSDLGHRLDSEYYLPHHMTLVAHLGAKVKVVRLGDIEVNGTYGVLPPSDDYGSGDVRLIRGMDLCGTVLSSVPEDAPYVPSRFLKCQKARVRPNEVMLLIKGATIAEPQSVGVVDESWTTQAIVNGSIYKFAVREPYDPYYVSAFMGSPFGLRQKLRAIANTGIFYNDMEAIRDFRVAIPDVDTQKQIGAYFRTASECKNESRHLIRDAIRDIDLLIDRKMEIDEAIRGDIEIAAWLAAHPLPESERNSE